MDTFSVKIFSRNLSVESDSDMSCDENTATLKEMVCLAEKKDRLIKGIFRSAHILEMCPEIVELCILPIGKSQDVTARIQHKLIEAYCWENDITIVQVDEAEFSDLFAHQRSKATDSDSLECVLVTSRAADENEDLLEFEERDLDLDEYTG